MWFLREFEYDSDLLRRDEIDDKCLVGLVGVVGICRRVIGGHTFVNLNAFANKSMWDDSNGAAPNSAATIERRS